LHRVAFQFFSKSLSGRYLRSAKNLQNPLGVLGLIEGKNHGKEKILLVRKKGPQEDIIAGYFKAMNEVDRKPLLNIQTIILDSIFTIQSLQKN
jgi:hypothetical protein